MTPQEKQEMEDLKEQVTKLENILYGISDDVRTKAVIRENIVIKEHVAGKPTIIDKNGKQYNLETV